MDILVYGAGAVGGYLGAVLAEQGHNVTLIARQTTADLIQTNGLTVVHTEQETIKVQPETVTSARQAFLSGQRYDLILLTMKSYDVASSLNSLSAFCPKPYPKIITLQNGIGLEELVVELFEAENVIAGSLTTPLTRETPERVRVERIDRGLALAPVVKQKMDKWVDLFSEAGISTIAVKDYRSLKWSKALLNMVGNATSAIVNRHPGAIYKYGPTFDLEMEMLRETLAVMRSLGIKTVDLPGSPTKKLAFAARRLPAFLAKPILSNVVAEGRGEKMPSFHIDLTAGKGKNEVIYHNGAVAMMGQEQGVPTPVNAALNDILTKLVRGDLDWKIYDGSPARLVEEARMYKKQMKDG